MDEFPELAVEKPTQSFCLPRGRKWTTVAEVLSLIDVEFVTKGDLQRLIDKGLAALVEQERRTEEKRREAKLKLKRVSSLSYPPVPKVEEFSQVKEDKAA